MASGGVSGLGLAVASFGGLLIYTGVTNVPLLDAVRSFARGVVPRARGQVVTDVRFSEADDGGAVTPANYLRPSGSGGTPAIAQAALRYLGTPYRWGGKAPGGLDCSGLVYRAILDATGAKAPLGSYGQSTWRGFSVIPRSELGAGDVLWWPGHVAVALDNDTCVSAPRPGTVVRTEPIASAGPVGSGQPARCLRYNGYGSTTGGTSNAAGGSTSSGRGMAA